MSLNFNGTGIQNIVFNGNSNILDVNFNGTIVWKRDVSVLGTFSYAPPAGTSNYTYNNISVPSGAKSVFIGVTTISNNYYYTRTTGASVDGVLASTAIIQNSGDLEYSFSNGMYVINLSEGDTSINVNTTFSNLVHSYANVRILFLDRAFSSYTPDDTYNVFDKSNPATGYMNKYIGGLCCAEMIGTGTTYSTLANNLGSVLGYEIPTANVTDAQIDYYGAGDLGSLEYGWACGASWSINKFI